MFFAVSPLSGLRISIHRFILFFLTIPFSTAASSVHEHVITDASSSFVDACLFVSVNAHSSGNLRNQSDEDAAQRSQAGHGGAVRHQESRALAYSRPVRKREDDHRYRLLGAKQEIYPLRPQTVIRFFSFLFRKSTGTLCSLLMDQLILLCDPSYIIIS